jgi:hypothetical protein
MSDHNDTKEFARYYPHFSPPKQQDEEDLGEDAENMELFPNGNAIL